MLAFIPLWLFAIAALLPAVFLAVGIAFGGLWAWAALGWISIFTAVIDKFTPNFMTNAAPECEFPASNALLVALAAAQITLMPAAVWHLAGQAPFWDKIGLGMGAAMWLGQIGNPAAHELIHRGPRALFALGAVMFAMVLFGHHSSAHRLVHHRYVATPQDPNTARLGEGYYAFFLRAWVGSFKAGWQAETALRARHTAHAGLHPFVAYVAVSAGCLAVAYGVGGGLGVLIWGVLALSATGQLLLSDYVQHYGLMRHKDPSGKYEPVQNHHSWNAAPWYSSAMMLNAPRHSDHHTHPARSYQALRLPSADSAPRLPWPLPIACTIALIPPLWKRRIRPHLEPWINANLGAPQR
jgi:alkane 1-monooxygenase